jgi:hypothetical protein
MFDLYVYSVFGSKNELINHLLSLYFLFGLYNGMN